MNVRCLECLKMFDDKFRSTLCPHEAFLANDGHNNFKAHHESPITPAKEPAPMTQTVYLSMLPHTSEGIAVFSDRGLAAQHIVDSKEWARTLTAIELDKVPPPNKQLADATREIHHRSSIVDLMRAKRGQPPLRVGGIAAGLVNTKYNLEGGIIGDNATALSLQMIADAEANDRVLVGGKDGVHSNGWCIGCGHRSEIGNILMRADWNCGKFDICANCLFKLKTLTDKLEDDDHAPDSAGPSTSNNVDDRAPGIGGAGAPLAEIAGE